MKDSTEVKVGDKIRIVSSGNENGHFYDEETLCKVLSVYRNDFDKIEYRVISQRGQKRTIPELTQYILREDFEVVL